ncbi:hypothetical protein P8A22_19295 [Streptomyces laculatispora]|uniref:Uncharacterized protein n=1 Tax=Streptomyces laculatispora TaxID=887464 RepID=A0ABY9I548_9ACTN|nr:hypothetical protein [Streptomyces laculatispora]WLQ41920.1 hypothetical protein P8A22_19295 [Streptomyces laculatispora]
MFVVPGRRFFVDAPCAPLSNGHVTRCFRMSLSAPEKTLIDEISLVAEALEEMRAAAR